MKWLEKALFKITGFHPDDLTKTKKSGAHGPPPYIHEYVWKGVGSKARRVGVILGIRRDDKTLIGWSKVNEKAGDKFNAEAGIAEALRKATENKGEVCPPRYRRKLRAFQNRCKRYFKGCLVVEVVPAK